ncbi:hypothetical protein SAMN05216562_0251 [Microbulbifer marinus]|uniref:Uncharacterized protein n=1 Tax=Microbulbifer marinus TaxID=658218 RepID=A0A1H3VTP3_9GAMM|nr:hypothetical protein SAMN05216562_0251 [Microbulbifer marinus]
MHPMLKGQITKVYIFQLFKLTFWKKYLFSANYDIYPTRVICFFIKLNF